MSFIAGLASLAFPAASQTLLPPPGQICALGAAGIGQQASVICKDVHTGTTTQTIALGNTVSGANVVGGNLIRSDDDRVLVTNQAGGAVLLLEVGGRLVAPVELSTGSEGSLSGVLGDGGAYVLTGTRLLFLPSGYTKATSSQKLLIGDGSAAQVTLAGGYAYVSEKSGSLEAFLLDRAGNLASPASAVAGVTPGVIVGITGTEDTDLVVAPIAHLASNPAQAAISVVSGESQVQSVATKEVAACWTNHDHGEVCVSNPGSMTISCGHLRASGFTSYTGVAGNPAGASVFDLDLRSGFVGVQATRSGVPVLQTYQRDGVESDFLTLTSEFPVGTATATGALLLPAISR